MLILYPYVKRLFCFLLFLSGSLAMSSSSNSLLVISDLLLPGASEAAVAAAAAAARVSGVLLNAGECDVSALVKSNEASSDDSFCRFCGLAPRGAEILFTCHRQADQIRIGIGISCPRLIRDQIAEIFYNAQHSQSESIENAQPSG